MAAPAALDKRKGSHRQQENSLGVEKTGMDICTTFRFFHLFYLITP